MSTGDVADEHERLIRGALVGGFIADCPLCFDAPRRFDSPGERDAWAATHWMFSRHGVRVGIVRQQGKVSR